MAELQHAGGALAGAALPAHLVAIDVIDPNPITDVAVTAAALAPAAGTCVRDPDGRWRARVVVDLGGVALGAADIRVGFTWKGRRYTQTASVTVVRSRPGPASTGLTSLRVATGAAPDVRSAEDRLAGLDRYTGGWVRTPTTFEGVLFDQPLIIKAPTVIRESAIRTGQTSSGRMIVVDSAAGGSLVLEDSEVDGCGTAVLGLGYNDCEVRRTDIHSCSDGIRVNSRCLVEDSWVHGLARSGTLHPDCIQTSGGTGVRIRGNVLDCTGLGDDGQLDLGNAAVQMGAETNRVRDVTVEDNWLIGGNYTVNIRTAVEGPIAITGNRFALLRRYGPVKCARPPAHAMTLDGNVHDDGSAVTPSYW